MLYSLHLTAGIARACPPLAGCEPFLPAEQKPPRPFFAAGTVRTPRGYYASERASERHSAPPCSAGTKVDGGSHSGGLAALSRSAVARPRSGGGCLRAECGAGTCRHRNELTSRTTHIIYRDTGYSRSALLPAAWPIAASWRPLRHGYVHITRLVRLRLSLSLSLSGRDARRSEAAASGGRNHGAQPWHLPTPGVHHGPAAGG
jgi:hypothetical protein